MVTDSQGKAGHLDPEADREIPRGTDEESVPDDSRGTGDKSAKSKSTPSSPHGIQHSHDNGGATSPGDGA